MKVTHVHWFGKEFHTTVVTQKFAKITILLLQCRHKPIMGNINQFMDYLVHGTQTQVI